MKEISLKTLKAMLIFPVAVFVIILLLIVLIAREVNTMIRFLFKQTFPDVYLLICDVFKSAYDYIENDSINKKGL